MFHAFLSQIGHDLSISYKCYGSFHNYNSKKKEFVIVTSLNRVKKYKILSICLCIQTVLILLNLIEQLRARKVNKLEATTTIELILSFGFMLVYATFLTTRTFCSDWELMKDRITLLNGFLLLELKNPNLQSTLQDSLYLLYIYGQSDGINTN